ncbi:hypothetical protein KP13_32140 [Klebsiella pneumoniae subsp. pneumoniae Kp13]|nr:hypothetical protein KP13_32140 [Klebsiella pneumoniae subsp. pneumoniae Kp13]
MCPEIALDGSPAKRSAGRDISGCADISPGGGWRLTRPTGASHRLTPRRPGKRSTTGRCHPARSRFIAGWRLRLTRPTGASHTITPRRPGKRSAAGRWHQARSCVYAGWRLRLTRPTGLIRPGTTEPAGL